MSDQSLRVEGLATAVRAHEAAQLVFHGAFPLRRLALEGAEGTRLALASMTSCTPSAPSARISSSSSSATHTWKPSA
jgi:hypothetical protein